MKKILFIASLFAWVAAAEELAVGPGKKFSRIEDALATAKPGDTILVSPREGGTPHEKVALYVRTPGLTIRAAATDGKRVALSGVGFDFSGRGFVPRAIVQFNKGADGCVLDGFELSGAHNESHNGAGVRINQANNVTIRNCEIHGSDMGIMSGGDGTLNSATNQLIKDCVIHHNGDKTDRGYNHNLYLGGTSVTLSGCDIHSSLTGHNVKSRAHRIEITNCKIHDSANRELDLVDAAETSLPGSDAVITGCTIAKAEKCSGNRGVINFGQDGGKPRNGRIEIIGNKIRTPFVTPIVQLSSHDTSILFNENVVDNSGGQTSGQQIADIKISAMAKPIEGRANKIAASFSGPALDALGFKETTITGK